MSLAKPKMSATPPINTANVVGKWILTVILLLLPLQELPQAAGELNPRMFWIEWVKHPVGDDWGSLSAVAAQISEVSLSAALSLACRRSLSEKTFPVFPTPLGWNLVRSKERFPVPASSDLLLRSTYADVTELVSTLRSQSTLFGKGTAAVGFIKKNQ